jgi:hypothetical protein
MSGLDTLSAQTRRGTRPARSDPALERNNTSATATTALDSPLLGSAADLMALQRVAGNQAVQRLLQANAARQGTTSQIDRTIFVNGREKTKTSHGLSGVFGRESILTMLRDDKKRYFADKDEMYRYAKGNTDTMGWVPARNAWVKLNDELVVLGETHTADLTAASVIKAVGTERYMHESLTEAPEASPDVSRALRTREKGEHKRKFGKVSAANRSEDFFPKIKRGFADLGVVCNAKGEIRWQDRKPWRPQYVLLRLVLLYASGIQSRTSALKQFYDTHSDVLNRTASMLAELPDDPAQIHALLLRTPLSLAMATARSTALFTSLKDAVMAHVEAKIHAQHVQRPAPASFAAWKMAQTDYSPDPDSPIIQAEKARDRSMLEHIRDARGRHYLIYGLGKMHLERLDDVLTQENVRHSTVEDFVTQQEQAYPQ